MLPPFDTEGFLPPGEYEVQMGQGCSTNPFFNNGVTQIAKKGLLF
jgi:hypothetical protein